MAKGIGLIGNISGKLGNSVGYVIKNAASKQTQGFRVYQPRVTNPQSEAQMAQRIKMSAVTNLYRQWREVIRRSMEGKKYGDESRRAWLRMALGAQFDEGPWLAKGVVSPFPILGVPMSVGSLPALPFSQSGDKLLLVIPAPNNLAEGVYNTVGELSTFLISSGLAMAGDQITILRANLGNAVSSFTASSFYVSTADATDVTTFGLAPMVFEDGDTSVRFTTVNNAACIILSRDGGDDVHLRSTSYWVLSQDAAALEVYTPLGKQMAIASYIKASEANNDWPVTRSAGTSGGGTYSTTTRGGASVTLVGTKIDDGYVKGVASDGTAYYLYIGNSKVTSYGQYVQSYTSATATAPSNATSTNTVFFPVDGSISLVSSASDWFVANGGSSSVFFA